MDTPSLVKFTVDGEDFYVAPEVADEYRRRFDEQSARFSDVLEGADITIEPITPTANATARLDEFLADIEREGRNEQKRWQS